MADDLVQEALATLDDRENAALIAELMETAAPAPEPSSTLSMRELLHRGDDEYPAPVVAKSLTSAGYVFLYDTRTGDRSLTNRNMLPSQLKKKREDGSRVFTTRPPKAADGKVLQPKVGSHRCFLHPSDPDRALYDSLGLPICLKANLRNDFQAKRHAENRHRGEWRTVEDVRQRTEKEQDRSFQRQMMEAVASLAGNATKKTR